MKAKPIKMVPNPPEIGGSAITTCLIEEATHIELRLPCDPGGRTTILPIQLKGTRKGTPNWTWNGDIEKPTLKPSILIESQYAGIGYRSHSWVNDGKVKYLNDCTHELKNKTVDLLDI